MQQEACSVCFRHFSTALLPKVLPCGHSFCISCIPMVQTCPLCRQRLAARVQWPTNFALVSLLEKMERSHQQETVNPVPRRSAFPAAARPISSRTPGLSFMDGKSMTLAFRKTGLKVDIK